MIKRSVMNPDGEKRLVGVVDFATYLGVGRNVSVGRFSPFRVGLKTPISVNLKSPMHHVCY